MSAPNQQAIEAENLKYAFLAARTTEVLERWRETKQLSQRDEQVVGQARKFLATLADGAELVQTGHYRGHNARESMRALRLAMNPLKVLQNVPQDPDFAAYFGTLADTMERRPAWQDADAQKLQETEDFFKLLYDFISDGMTRNRQGRHSRPKERAAARGR